MRRRPVSYTHLDVYKRQDWNDVLRQQGDIPSRKFIAETITLRELPTAQPVPVKLHVLFENVVVDIVLDDFPVYLYILRKNG